ncbi:Trehalose-6-P synthase/phosphatase complex subunit [Paramarasmius palmivorus]|uniref:Trehalose-6-P synthase/phosphatase complex subunit n=1 Tax=Paramarasmius palmivorus TaxID=297713 RepID=A0AAW0BKE2_9AGAR
MTTTSQRVIIASLFLPQTVILGSPDDYDFESQYHSSPSPEPLAEVEAEKKKNLCDQVSMKLQSHSENPSGSGSSGSIPPPSIPTTPLANTTPATSLLTPAVPANKTLSIVEDLRDRASTVTSSAGTPRPGVSRSITGGLSGMNAGAMAGFMSTTPATTKTAKFKSDSAPASTSSTTTTSRAPNASEAHMHRSYSRRLSRSRPPRNRTRTRSASKHPLPESHSSPNSGPQTPREEEEEEEEPFYIEPNSHCNGGLKNAFDSVGPSLDRVWVGTLGTKTDEFSEGLKRNVEVKLREEENPGEVVWVKDDDFEGCYDEFCHQVLWPALHYAIPDAPRTKLFYESASYSQYVAVNRAFATKIKEIWRPGDVVWVNDYHLMLLPLMLRSTLPLSLQNSSNTPQAKIGFFLHISFPSSEIFRCLSVRSHLLRGMLGADLVGFQTANYARHFRQTCSRILGGGVETLPGGIQLGVDYEGVEDEGIDGAGRRDGDTKGMEGAAAGAGETVGGQDQGRGVGGGKGRFVDVGVFPMGIDVHQLKSRAEEKEVSDWVTLLRQRYRGMKLIVGRDKLDEIQGVRQKMLAFERFLEKDGDWVGKVVLIQIALPSSPSSSSSSPSTSSSLSTTTPSTTSSATSHTHAIEEEILTTVSHINSRFSTLTYQPVVFLHTQDVSFSQYLALLKVADVFLISSLREGMALRGHEFVVMQEGKGAGGGSLGTIDEEEGMEGGREGVLVLSEFTGSYTYSSGFRSCLPINPWDIPKTSDEIRVAIEMSREEAAKRWHDLNTAVHKQTAQTFVKGFLTRCLRSGGSSAFYKSSSNHTFATLSTFASQNKEKRTYKRIFVDWEGGLLPVPSSTGEIREVDRALETLKQLHEKGVEVYVVSGLPRSTLEAAVPVYVGVVAENGCFLRRADSNGEWEKLLPADEETTKKWKSACAEILNYFTERTPSSYIVQPPSSPSNARFEASVEWRFDGSDGWARRQAAEAQNHIFDSLGERYALRIIPSTNSFLVLPSNVSRAGAVAKVLSQASVQPPEGERENALVLSKSEKMLRRLAGNGVAGVGVEVVITGDGEEGECVRRFLGGL